MNNYIYKQATHNRLLKQPVKYPSKNSILVYVFLMPKRMREKDPYHSEHLKMDSRLKL